MDPPDRERFAKAVLLGQRIYMNVHAMLNLLQRIRTREVVRRGGRLDEQLSASLEDLGSCLKEFDQLTGIDMTPALDTLARGFDALKSGDTSGLYEAVQTLYRDNYLAAIVELSK
ncbi:MAG: hypothetical protein JSV27_06140 [Candidatus Bathyarchaeota archaeon]|nr:MAG: hypothetical protein JSV27_06140 [Candidatus Bathyarchaeota archaeon]